MIGEAPMLKTLAVSVACLLVLGTGFRSAAQKSKTKVNLSHLRSGLAKALEGHALLLKDQLNEQNSSANAGSYWLAYIQPKKTGHFAIKYRYNYNGKLYSHVETELRFRVGKTGCRRGPLGYGRYSKFCLGDTIILPIAVENFTEHEFSFKFTDEFVNDVDWTTDTDLNTTAPTANPLSPNFAFIGARSAVQLHRSLGYTLQRYATFEAKAPGRFNLTVSTIPPAGATAGGYPVIVLDRNTPITALLANEQVEGFSMGFNGQEYSSSSGGNTSYLTEVLVIQSGDQFTFEYGTEVHSGRSEREEKPLETKDLPPPYIEKLPFSFDKTWGYTGWIQDWIVSGGVVRH
jgi:hypothetical protein